MRVEHHQPVVAEATSASGTETKTVHLTVGPEPDNPDRQVTILWAWSEHLGRPFQWITTVVEPEPVEGSSVRWTLDLAPDWRVKLRLRHGAWCCGNPMARWRPPGFERPRVGTT